MFVIQTPGRVTANGDAEVTANGDPMKELKENKPDCCFIVWSFSRFHTQQESKSEESDQKHH